MFCLCAIAPLLGGAPARALDRSIATVIGLEAGVLRALRLDDLPAGAEIELSLGSRLAVTVYLMDQAAFARLPAVRGPLFTGLVTGRLGLRTRVVRAGDYFLVFDNRANRDHREVTLSLRVVPAPTAQGH